MKKHLFALSALGIASAASAQSSVTLFGIMDATIAHGSGSISSRNQLTRGGYGTPRIGFRGTEDLGGGMTAGFWLEAGVNTDDGTGGVTNTNNQSTGTSTAPAGTQGLTFARRSTIQLAGRWGEIRLGRDYNPQYWSFLAGDAFGNVGVGSAVNYTQSVSTFIQVRSSNSVAYFTPNWNGFTGNVMHYRGENASNVANSGDGTGTGIRLAYDKKPFSVGVGYGKTKYVSGDLTQRNISGGWDFGVARVVADLNRDKLGAVDIKGGAASVIVPVGVGEIKGAYSFHKTNAALTPEAKKFAIGYVHNLSKRTSLYATYARVRNSGGSAVALNGATTAANQSSTGFDLGVRHNF